MISENSERSLCQKTVMLKKKMKSPFQTRYDATEYSFFVTIVIEDSEKLVRSTFEVVKAK